jgi:amidase
MSIESIYSEKDGLGLAELVSQGEVTPGELVEEAIRRIELLDPQINAVIHRMFDQARAAAQRSLPDGPFKGVPFLLKDLLADYAGEPITSGSRFFKDFVPDQDTELVRRFKSTGIVVLGKTNTPEFGIMPYTEPEIFGPTNNPWNLERTVGGSSGGSGAAVAAGMVPIASAGDGGGSIRIPGSACGIFGLKPTRGRNPSGIIAGAYWFDAVVEHVLTRSVRDSAAMLDATHGYHTGAPHSPPPPERPFLEEVEHDPGKLRIAYTPKPLLGKSMHPDCIAGLEASVKLLESLGHTLVEDAPIIDRLPVSMAFLTTVAIGVAAEVAAAEKSLGVKATSKDFEASTWALVLVARRMNASQLTQSLRILENTSRTLGAFFDKYDVLLTPTLSSPPPITGSLQLQGSLRSAVEILANLNAGWLLEAAKLIETAAEDVYDFIPSTPLHNFSGGAAMSVPLYWNEEGLPIGMHFMSGYAEESNLFRLAGQLERAQPWFNRRPPISA